MARDPMRFLLLQPDGDRALKAYEHIDGYCDACSIQYERIYARWQASSSVEISVGDTDGFAKKRAQMQGVVRDIHFLLVSLQVVWKALRRFCDPTLYPNFAGALKPLMDKWSGYFVQYLEPRNTFEHYDDQVLGPDTRNNTPGYGVHLAPDGNFTLGEGKAVSVSKQAYEQLLQFRRELESSIDLALESAS